MKFTKILIFALAISLLFLSSSSFASEESHRAAVEEMLHLTEIDKLMDPMMDQMKAIMDSQVEQMGVSEETMPVFRKYNEKIMALMKKEMAWDKMKGDFIDLYIKVYTEEEINAINNFYKTPVGRKMLEKMPDLLQETMALTQVRVQQMMPEIQKLSQEMTQEMDKLKSEQTEN